MHGSSPALPLAHPLLSPLAPALATLASEFQELIYKRGFGKVNKSRVPLTDNAIIEVRCARCACFCTLCLPPAARSLPALAPSFVRGARLHVVPRPAGACCWP